MIEKRHRSVDVLVMTILLGVVIMAVNQCSQAHGGGWQDTQWNSGVNLKSAPGKECYFLFPGGGHVNLIAHDWKSVPPGSTITIAYKIIPKTGKPRFNSLDPAPAPPGLKPNFRPMLFNGDWNGEDSRFWPAGAQCAWLIADGKVHLYTIRLNPKLWTNVYGHYNTGGFKALLQHLYQIHLAFGGGNSFSHGIRVQNGTALFILISFSIQQAK